MPFRRAPGAAYGLTRATCYDDRFWTGSRKFPVLRFGGEWLAQAGFAVGQHVREQAGRKRIVIEPAT